MTKRGASRKKLLTRLSDAVQARVRGRPRVLEAAQHGIDPAQVSRSARTVLKTLHEGGYAAYIVGGGARDLMLGLRPKDFDVATDARPEQVRDLFERCRIIGRRFRLAHVWAGRHRIEVATFRGGHRSRQGRAHLARTVGGRILRDNAYGTIDQDAERRDFTINSLFYDPARNVVLDFVGGANDLQAGLLRMVGKPAVRFREDPVRLLRAVRFAAKLDFRMEPAMERLIPELAALLGSIAPARMFEEVAKLLHSGAAERTFGMLREKALLEQLFPRTAEVLEQAHPEGAAFVRQALADTDARVSQALPVSPAFAYAVMMWPHVCHLLDELPQDEFAADEALAVCADRALQHQERTISIPYRHARMIREIWARQPQLEQGPRSHPERVIGRAGFRAAYDFLGLRAKVDGRLEAVHRDWTRLQGQRPTGSAPRRRRQRKR